jgi:hypothetical protein
MIAILFCFPFTVDLFERIDGSGVVNLVAVGSRSKLEIMKVGQVD